MGVWLTHRETRRNLTVLSSWVLTPWYRATGLDNGHLVDTPPLIHTPVWSGSKARITGLVLRVQGLGEEGCVWKREWGVHLMPKKLNIRQRAEIHASVKGMGDGIRETARNTGHSTTTVRRYLGNPEVTKEQEEAFDLLVERAKKRRTDEWIAIGAAIRHSVARDLPDIVAETPTDIKSMVTAAAIATDKVALLEGRLGAGNQPLALALLVNGDIGIDNRTINISERELESLAEARALRG